MVSFRLDDEITLREFSTGDADAVYKTVTRNYDHLHAFMHWMVPDYSLRSARQFLRHTAEGRANRKNLTLGIFRQRSLIGVIGFVSFDWQARKTEIGYWISKEEEGRGIVTQAAKRLIAHAFKDLGLNRIEIRCSTRNLRSAAIPERLGFKKEGVLREAELRNGVLHDFSLYGLLRAEWQDKEN